MANMTSKRTATHILVKKGPLANENEGTHIAPRLSQKRAGTRRRSSWLPVDVDNPSKGLGLKISRRKSVTHERLKTPGGKYASKQDTPQECSGARLGIIPLR
jgi:hypothetical protein